MLTDHLESSMKGTVMEKCIGQLLQASVRVWGVDGVALCGHVRHALGVCHSRCSRVRICNTSVLRYFVQPRDPPLPSAHSNHAASSCCAHAPHAPTPILATS